jgi:N-dimethylarginine dimethylaminohydrolase
VYLKMYSTNEWDQLKEVIVGIADDAAIPVPDVGIRCVNYADKKHLYQIPWGSYPQQVIDEANQDLDTFCRFLINEGIKVHRPDKKYKPEYYNYCPRDIVLIHGDYVLATPSPLKQRRKEFMALYNALPTIEVAPEPNRYILYNSDCISNADILALNETEPCFDAANILRANDHLYYLVSNSGNEIGADWLQEQLPKVKVHKLKGIYSYMHLDSTIAFLREGLMLLNPSRIKNKNILPKELQNWDVIWCPEPTDIGHYPGYCNASIWINMNLFSINPSLVILEENQDSLRKELEKHKIECAMLPMRHQRTLGGGFHCVTLDLVRE